jgi:hypothetical protein
MFLVIWCKKKFAKLANIVAFYYLCAQGVVNILDSVDKPIDLFRYRSLHYEKQFNSGQKRRTKM